MKQAKKARSIRSRNPVRARSLRRLPFTFAPRPVVAGVIAILGAAVLLAAGLPSRQADVAIVGAKPEARTPPESNVPTESHPQPDQPRVAAVVRLDPKQAAAPKTAATLPAADTHSVHATNNVPPPQSVKAVEMATAVGPVFDSTPTAAAVESMPAATIENMASVTIAGCVELDNQTVWLKDASGEDVPTSRSWKSGFLKKRPSRIELMDTTHSLQLRNYAGQRVAATGTLVNREMKARSLHRVAASCR